MVFCRFHRLTDHWKGPDQPLVIGLAFQVGGCGWLWSVDAVEDRQPHDQKEIADAIERSPRETTDCFEHRVVDLPDDLRLL